MKYKYIVLSLGLLVTGFSMHAQGKKEVGLDAYKIWKRAKESAISNDGKWVSYTLETNQKTNNQIKLRTFNGKDILTYLRGTSNQFTYGSSHLFFLINPDFDTLKNLRRKKVEKEDLPLDSLGIFNLSDRSIRKIPRVVSYKLPKKWNGWFAYQQKDTLKDGAKKEAYQLTIERNNGSMSFNFPAVSDYQISEKGGKIAFVSLGNDSTFLPGVYVFDVDKTNSQSIYRAKGKYNSLVWSEKGNKLSFVADTDTTKNLIRPYNLQLWKNGEDSSKTLVNNSNPVLNGKLLVSEKSKNFFSKDESKLYFGLKPFPILQDTSLLEEEIVNVEVWNYQDARLHTQQKVEKEIDLNKSYLSVVHLNNEKIISLSSQSIPNVQVGNEGNSSMALGINNQPYQSLLSWEGGPYYNDLYIINTENGASKKIKEKARGRAELSPAGKYVYWYNVTDSAWFTYEIATEILKQVTDNETVAFYREIHDSPSHPAPYGTATWSENDDYLLVYDRFDIWEISPDNSNKPKKLTNNGRANKIRYRYEKLNDDERFIKKGQKLILRGFNETDKSTGYYELNYKPKAKVKNLIDGPFAFKQLKKAQKSSQLLFTKENFRLFPDFYTTDSKFKSIKKISDINPQQADYKWGDISLYKWKTFDGKMIEGMLVKPDNFDPNKKYPLLVNFYDKSSNALNNHRDPYPHRSTINYSLFASKGYVIFNPDVHYEIGAPGKSAYNCVVSGIEALIKEGYIDKERIGMQGHSWGGYQAAQLVTMTDIFACAEAGAPVPNMISAYGGIRWWTGLSRMFQYEHTQSRIGGSLWEYPERYIENSPIFSLDKVNTPLLIMHNDADGHVPWYQGIELFVSLRRLGKPSWLLNYQGEPHWPLKEQNRIDFNKRLEQFFDHYLKDGPEPRWMKEGVPATRVGIDQALDSK